MEAEAPREVAVEVVVEEEVEARDQVRADGKLHGESFRQLCKESVPAPRPVASIALSHGRLDTGLMPHSRVRMLCDQEDSLLISHHMTMETRATYTASQST